jgi:DGQHR domain-containing protein
MAQTTIECMRGRSANRDVVLGFAPANLLYSFSFSDVLDEDSGRGYQRRFNAQHSLDFRRYIQLDGSTTIPLTFNLRPRTDEAWRVTSLSARQARLDLVEGAGKLMAQVDCQHRLGHLADAGVELPFMCFLGLSDREEMEIFNVINSKAKGLSASLLDFHDAHLCADLAGDRPELYIALFLKSEPASPWFRQLDLGGAGTSGLTRRASLRTLQKAIKRFLTRTKIMKALTIEQAAQVVLDFWSAVALAMAEQWTKPRKHLLTKGIGVYALMDIAADLFAEAPKTVPPDRAYFAASLIDLARDFDWSTDGPLQGLGGEGGVKTAVDIIRNARKQARFRIVANG